MILCDTNILIEFYKGRADVMEIFNAVGISNLAVSVVTVGELFYGARDKRELRNLREHISLLNQIPIDEYISNVYLSLLEKYSLSHRLSIPDALIAATALYHSIPLYTLNVKDFRYISGLSIYP
ncbi:MAG TPA: type II toxin-antitoxin system VapC family toxin [Anaerolineales bacterium]|nr:type II toxin-antitoxin system VapC family toxin [Anaerolineales bacterium]